ncbi:MAG: D-glycero-beta-D-manno-heptose-7-phosphate kinase [Cyclobacteriaceae bacterium]
MSPTEKIFGAFARIRVLVIGDVMLDSYIWGSVDRISPEAPVPVINVQKRDHRLGGAANVALNLKSLGAQVTLIALAGKDTHGELLAGRMKEAGLHTEGLVFSADRPTTVKTRIIASHQHVVRVDDELDHPATAQESDSLQKLVEKFIANCDVVVFEDYDKGTITPALIQSTVDAARRKGIPTVVDPKRRNFMAYKHVSLFKPNLKELREGLKTDVDGGNKQQVETAVERLRKELQAERVMVTLSEHGVFIASSTDKTSLPAHVREIADVSGAGDTVVSVAALALAAGLTDRSVAALSNLAGGLVCQHVGVVPIDLSELRREAALLGPLD